MNVRSTSKAISKKRVLLFVIVAAAAITGSVLKIADDYGLSGGSGPGRNQKPAQFDKNQYPTGQASSLWAVVNKGRKLPSDYAPTGLIAPAVSLRFSPGSPEIMLRNDAAIALKELFFSAEAQGLPLILTSGYRSYASQAAIYNRNVARDGQAATDAASARPGHSEHQTGLAADIGSKTRKCEFEQCFGALPEGQWVASNAYKYGFIIRYEQGRSGLTGYDFEPWHLRYVGKELAKELQETDQTMEQFFGLPAFADYSSGPLQL